MMRATSFIGFLLIIAVSSADTIPNQIHISLTSVDSEIMIAWSTPNATCSKVQIGLNSSLGTVFEGATIPFTSPSTNYTQFLHRVTVRRLEAGTRYFYVCGCDGSWSKMNTFTSKYTDESYAYRFAVYGDMGNHVNAWKTIPRLIDEVQSGSIDAVLHVGDFAYNLEDDEGRNGDLFLNNIQQIASAVPYMTCPGNHESGHNFSHYMNRFVMPNYNETQSLWYSFDVPNAHIISLSTEVYFQLDQIMLTPTQFNWLVNDLKQANAPAARAKRPWIITMGHRPMYCSPNDDNDDCHHSMSLVRDGYFGLYGMEKLFRAYGVDLAFWAHEHSYERSWPVYNSVPYNNVSEPYVNPAATTHIIAGAAGCPENQDAFQKDGSAWSAFRANIYGYGKLTIQNKTHLYWEQLTDSSGEVIGTLQLVKNKE